MSNKIKSLSQHQAKLSQAKPVIDEGRVAAIKQAVVSGKYTLDAARVADKLLRMDRDLPDPDATE